MEPQAANTGMQGAGKSQTSGSAAHEETSSRPGKREFVPKLLGGIAAAAAGVAAFLLNVRKSAVDLILTYAKDSEYQNPIRSEFEKSQLPSSETAAIKVARETFIKARSRLEAARNGALAAAQPTNGGQLPDQTIHKIQEPYHARIAHLRRELYERPIAAMLRKKEKWGFANLDRTQRQDVFAITALVAISVGAVVYLGSKWFMRKPAARELAREDAPEASHAGRVKAEDARNAESDHGVAAGA